MFPPFCSKLCLILLLPMLYRHYNAISLYLLYRAFSYRYGSCNNHWSSTRKMVIIMPIWVTFYVMSEPGCAVISNENKIKDIDALTPHGGVGHFIVPSRQVLGDGFPHATSPIQTSWGTLRQLTYSSAIPDACTAKYYPYNLSSGTREGPAVGTRERRVWGTEHPNL